MSNILRLVIYGITEFRTSLELLRGNKYIFPPLSLCPALLLVSSLQSSWEPQAQAGILPSGNNIPHSLPAILWSGFRMFIMCLTWFKNSSLKQSPTLLPGHPLSQCWHFHTEFLLWIPGLFSPFQREFHAPLIYRVLSLVVNKQWYIPLNYMINDTKNCPVQNTSRAVADPVSAASWTSTGRISGSGEKKN